MTGDKILHFSNLAGNLGSVNTTNIYNMAWLITQNSGVGYVLPLPFMFKN